MNKTPMTALIMALMLGLATAHSNQASTEYVQKSIEGLRADFSSRLTSLATANNQLANEVRLLKQAQQAADAARKADIASLTPKRFSLGELYQGGVVFYVDESGQHGLVVSRTDLGEQSFEWRNGESGERITNAKGVSLYSGETNTSLIIAAQTIDNQEGQFAALTAARYQVLADGITPCEALSQAPCYGHWHLPSLHELLTLYSAFQSAGIGELTQAPYWSSTENATTDAWLVDFSSGQPLVAEKSIAARLRAVHAF